MTHGSSMTTDVSAGKAPSCKPTFGFSLQFYAAALLKPNFILSIELAQRHQYI